MSTTFFEFSEFGSGLATTDRKKTFDPDYPKDRFYAKEAFQLLNSNKITVIHATPILNGMGEEIGNDFETSVYILNGRENPDGSWTLPDGKLVKPSDNQTIVNVHSKEELIYNAALKRSEYNNTDEHPLQIDPSQAYNYLKNVSKIDNTHLTMAQELAKTQINCARDLLYLAKDPNKSMYREALENEIKSQLKSYDPEVLSAVMTNITSEAIKAQEEMNNQNETQVNLDEITETKHACDLIQGFCSEATDDFQL